MSSNNDFYSLVIDKLEIIPDRHVGKSIILWGWAIDTYGGDDHEKFTVYVNGKKVPFRVRRTPRDDVSRWYAAAKNNNHPGFIIRADVEDQTIDSIELQVNDHEPKTLSASYIKEAWNPEGFDISFDFYYEKPGWISAGGWIFCVDPEKLKLEVLDAKGQPVKKAKIATGVRFDVERAYFVKEEAVCGFSISIKQSPLPPMPLSLKVVSGARSWTVPIRKGEGASRSWFKYLTPSKIKHGLRYLKTNGIRPLLGKISFHTRAKAVDFNDEYNQWFRAQRTSKAELDRQRAHHFEKRPLISLIVAAYNTPIDLLEKMIDSVREQTYDNWQLCIADGSTNDKVEQYLSAHPDPKISWCRLEDNLGISGNMNAAAALANGDYIALYDHDDFLEPDCLYEVVKAINEKEYAFIYTDEDKYEDASGRFVGPNFKPDISPALLEATNYICHFLAVRRDVYDQVGELRSEYDGAQDFDLVLRLMDIVKPEDVHHIPRILYHWRMCEGSTALNADSKKWAYTAGERTLKDWLKRNHLPGKIIETGVPGHYHIRFEPQGNPLVSIIIPNKDHASDLRICVDSIMRRMHYRNFEVIVVENNSTEPETFEEYDHLKKDYANLRVLEWNHPFNYSAINNYAVKHANGDYFLFLNNDTEMINEWLLDEMVGQAQRDNVGAVGAKLYYEDGTIQHNGVIIGHSGVAGHALIGQTDASVNYRVRTTHDVSAVTAACMLVSRKVFEEAGGFNEDLAVAYNDIDFCLRIDRLGYRIVQDPFAVAFHYESRTRGYEDSAKKKARFEKEVRKMYSLWPDELRSEDPYYNPNLDLTGITYGLRTKGEVNPYINPTFLKEDYYTAGTIRPKRPEEA